jgi:2-oxoglutarate ferredoxin oxidoreductase subunit delta
MIDRGESPRDSQEPGRESGHHSVLTRGTLVIDVEACKGCELCIDACPPGVLEMGNEFNLRGYRYPWLRPGCTGCKACSQICPDFVFQVYKYAVPLDLPVNPRTGGANS